MNKITFDKLIIELTRSCNMFPPCKHCFRGDSQNISIDKKYIDGLLNQTEIINSLFFTGGEPTLAIEEMEYILNKLYENRIPLFDFGFITNGLIYDEKVISIIKKYSKLVKLCCEIGSGKPINAENNVVIGISIDKYHNNQKLAEINIRKYKIALKGYAQVVRVADGNIPRKEGNGTTLADGICNLNLEEAVVKRIEILDSNHKPLCPQYQTYKMIKPEQIIVCCDIYLSAKGNLLIAGLGLHDYSIVDKTVFQICTTNDDIYESIIKYNRNRLDCCTLLKLRLEESMKNPLKGLHDVMFLTTHKSEDNSEVIKKELPDGYMNLDDFSIKATFNPTIIDDLIINAKNRNYLM